MATNREEAELLCQIYFPAYPPVRSLAEAKRRGDIPLQFMPTADAMLARIAVHHSPRPTTGIPARSAYNDPGWDNLIRAMEEDR